MGYLAGILCNSDLVLKNRKIIKNQEGDVQELMQHPPGTRMSFHEAHHRHQEGGSCAGRVLWVDDMAFGYIAK